MIKNKVLLPYVKFHATRWHNLENTTYLLATVENHGLRAQHICKIVQYSLYS